MNTLEKMQSRFPHIYDSVYDDKSVLYTLLSVYASRYDDRNSMINRLKAMTDISATYDEDLEHRWGAFLNVSREPNESYDDYRARLMITYSSLSGGTAEAIKYAVASVLGITSDRNMIDEYIHVYDGWEYDGDVDDDNAHEYGSFVVVIELSDTYGDRVNNNKILNAINRSKAAGTAPYLAFTYREISEIARLQCTDTVYDNRMYIYGDDVVTQIDENSYDKVTGRDDNTAVIDTTSVVAISNSLNSFYHVLNQSLILNGQEIINDECVDVIRHL